MFGTIPRSQLDLFLKDLRRLPTGWLTGEMEEGDFPSPLGSNKPIVVTDVLGMEPLVEAPADTREDAHLYKITPELWKHLEDKTPGPVRVEITLTVTPPPFDQGWRAFVERVAPTLFIESQLGAYVIGLISPEDVRSLAGAAMVSGIRLARPARVDIDPAVVPKGDNARALRQTRLGGLQTLDRVFLKPLNSLLPQPSLQGRGVRIAVLGNDFRGYEELIKAGRLPARTSFVDLTTERNPEIYPEPVGGDGKELGHGALCAAATALAAPDADIVLVRVDGFGPSQMHDIIRRIQGEFMMPHVAARQEEVERIKGLLRRRRQEILDERKAILRDYTDETELMRDFAFLGPVRGWIISNREWSLQRLAWQEQLERVHTERENRFWAYVRQARTLKGIDVVVSPFVWNDGHPLGGVSALSHWFDDRPVRPPLWVQAAGDTRGQTWVGRYEDADANGVMEFAPPTTSIKPGRWNHELNFLAWQPYQGARTPDLPAGLKARVSLQWREPHDPAYFTRLGEDDPYRKPLADLRLVVLRQRDPDGKSEPGDLFDVVARSPLYPQRLDNAPSAATYEQAVELTVEKPGRYAVRIERERESEWALRPDPKTGRMAFVRLENPQSSGIRPAGAASLPALEKKWELWPRLFVHALDAGPRRQGRPVWLDYTTDSGGIGMPADARQAIVVGAANLNDKQQPYTALGPPAGMPLYENPLLLTYDALELAPDGAGGANGSAIATSFAGGFAATLLSTGLPFPDVYLFLQSQKGQVLRVPGQ